MGRNGDIPTYSGCYRLQQQKAALLYRNASLSDQAPTVLPYEVIDGQQRLTTLFLLVSFLKNEGKTDISWYRRPALDFECREHSRRTLSAIFNNNIDTLPPEDSNSAILNGYRIIQKVLPQSRRSITFRKQPFPTISLKRFRPCGSPFSRYGLNHYFEIMNNRGEQLEKHEVLKSRLLEILNRIPDAWNERKAGLFSSRLGSLRQYGEVRPDGIYSGTAA